MRQGPYKLFLWPESYPDIRLDSATPGLIDDKKFIELNIDLKNSKMLEHSTRDLLKRQAAENSLLRLKTKMHMMQKSIPFATLHVELPEVVPAHQFNGQTVYYGVLPKKIRNSAFEDQKITSKIKDRAAVGSKKSDSDDRTENFFIPIADSFDTHLYVRDFDHEFRRDEKVLEMYFKATVDEGDPRSYKPSNNETRKIEEILRKPNFATLDPKEKNLIWKFRYSLQDKPEALPKVLKSDLSSTQETENELCVLIKEWTKIKYDDAIYLLSRDFSLNNVVVKNFSDSKLEINTEIRKYAVDILRDEDYEVLGTRGSPRLHLPAARLRPQVRAHRGKRRPVRAAALHDRQVARQQKALQLLLLAHRRRVREQRPQSEEVVRRHPEEVRAGSRRASTRAAREPRAAPALPRQDPEDHEGGRHQGEQGRQAEGSLA